MHAPRLPMVERNAHIGILGGSFDPPHLCHQLLALSFLALEPIDQLWIIPCAQHAFKNAVTDFSHRLRMCEIAFRRIEQIRVLDIEEKLAAPSYTALTLDHILREHPDLSLHLAIGSDLLSSFHTWHRAQDIVEKAKIVIFERASYPITTLPEILQNARLHQGYQLPDISSTSLRNFFKDAHTDGTVVDRDVVSYIAEHKLYR